MHRKLCSYKIVVWYAWCRFHLKCFSLLLKFILHVALYLPVITFLHHHSFLFLVVFNSNLNTIAPFLYVCCILNAVCIDRPDYDGLLVEIDTVDKKRKSKTIVELSQKVICNGLVMPVVVSYRKKKSLFSTIFIRLSEYL